MSTLLMKEGKATFTLPELAEAPTRRMKVFYNPVMEENRDISVLMLQHHQRSRSVKLAATDLMAGCGVRGLRWALEVRGMGRILLNDVNGLAVEVARRNVELNHQTSLVEVYNMEANQFLALHSSPRRRLDVVDVDPFGSPAPYVDSSVRALKSGGLLALTATDLAALTGAASKACYRRYGSRPLRTEYAFENAIRILVSFVSRVAAIHKMGFKPLLCYHRKHYVRVYGVLRYGAEEADGSLRNIGFILHCVQCRFREQSNSIVNGRCETCGSKLRLIGPLWLGEISNRDTVASILKDLERRRFRLKKHIKDMLTRMLGEYGMPPTHYVLDDLSSALRVKPPRLEEVIEKLRASGYRACRVHIPGNRLKTDAPVEFIKYVLRP
ncbi:MAG: tRNA (guanine(10)-N(2))-dimethyltransferase [Candidatus Bathyarchaeia archaeon]